MFWKGRGHRCGTGRREPNDMETQPSSLNPRRILCSHLRFTENGVIGNYEELVTRSLCPCQLVINRNALTSNLPQGLLG